VVWTYYTLVDADSNDDALAPVLSSADVEIPIDLTPADGTDVRRFPASAVNVLVLSGNKLVEQTKAPSSLKWTVLVTDCRMITYCEKFDKGAFSGFSYKLVRQGWPDRVDSARRVRS